MSSGLVRQALVLVVTALFVGCGTARPDPVSDNPAPGSSTAAALPTAPDPVSDQLINPLTGKRYGQITDPASLAEARQIDAAEKLYREGLYDQARVAIDALVAQGTRQASPYLLKARLTLQAGDVAGTVPWCERAIAISPGWVEPRILAAKCHLELKHYAAADSVFGDLDRLFPEGPWGPYGRGLVAVLQNREADAAAAFDLALLRDPRHLPSLSLRARVARAQGEVKRERELLLAIAQLDPTDLSVRMRLADLALADGRRDDARVQLQAAYDQEPRPEFASRLADIANQMGDTDAAADWRAKAAAGEPAVPLTDDEDLPVIR